MRQPEDVGFRHGWLFAPPGERPRMQVACIGSACVDRSYVLRGAVLGSSNPAEREPRLFGGVARNVCENLARLGVEASLVSVVGNDPDGRAMLDELRECGAIVDLAKAVDSACDEYAAILDRGELLVGAADMRAIESFSVDDLNRRWKAIEGARFVFVDCNVSAAVLQRCFEGCANGTPGLAIDAVSEPKARRLPARLDGAGVLFINEGEARAYLDRDAPPEQLAAELLARGARAIVLTRGERGTLCADGTILAEIPAPDARRISATGAGDALVAGTLWQLIAGTGLQDAVRTGTQLAGLTLETVRSVRSDLTRELLGTRMAAVSR
jgi:pseudouridine kinase